jgi:hypothetical protein
MRLPQKITVAICALWLLAACGHAHSGGGTPALGMSLAKDAGAHHYVSVVIGGVAPVPTPAPHLPPIRESLVKAIHNCDHPQLQNVIDGKLYITCAEGSPRWMTRIVALTKGGQITASTAVPMYYVRGHQD